MKDILNVHQKDLVTQNMRIWVAEKEIVVIIESKISDLSASKDTSDLKSSILTVVKIKNEKVLKARATLIFDLCLGSTLAPSVSGILNLASCLCCISGTLHY